MENYYGEKVSHTGVKVLNETSLEGVEGRVLDRWSMELFVNKGKQAASMKIDTEAPADKITFSSDRPVLMDLDLFTIEH